MAEAVGVAQEVGRAHRLHLGIDFIAQGLHVRGRGRLGVQAHVKQAELALAQQLQAALEVARGGHAVEQVARQRGRGVDMRAQALQGFPLPAEVLHELAGQLHRIAFDARDAGHRAFVHLGQHVVQAVAELVEERDHVVVRQQAGPPTDRQREVAHQVRHRQLQPAIHLAIHVITGPQPARTTVVHPRARLLAGAGVGIEIEGRHLLAVAPHGVVAHRVVPHRRGVGAQRHAEQPFDEVEEAVEDARHHEVGFQRLAAEGVALLLELLAGIGAVPGLQVRQGEFGGGEVAQLSQFSLGVRAGAACQVAHEGQHRLRRARHLGRQQRMGV